MPTYKKRNLADALTTTPPLAPLTGGQVAKADRVASVFAEQDRVLGHGRRIVSAVGLQGADAFQVVSTNPTSMSQTHPAEGRELLVDRKEITLTPGHYLRAVALCLPSGATQKPADSGYESAGAGGSLKFVATYDNGADTETVTTYIEVAPSKNTYAAESDYDGASFAELRRYTVDLHPPLKPTAELAKWSDGCEVTLRVYYVDGLRCVDVCVFEEPIAYAASYTDTWATALYTNGSGEALNQYPAKYPVTSTNKGGDPGNGTAYAASVATRQSNELGPFLLCASAFNEATEPVTSTEVTAITTSSTSFVDLWRTGVTAWSDDAAGWSLSAGGNAPGHNTSGPALELRDKDRVVTCKVSVYAKRETNAVGTATVRAQVSGVSMTDIAIASSTFAWYETQGALQCGFGAEDPSSLVLLGKTTDSGTTLHIRYAQIQYSAPAA